MNIQKNKIVLLQEESHKFEESFNIKRKLWFNEKKSPTIMRIKEKKRK